MLSVVVPIYNEENAVHNTIADLQVALSGMEHELIAVNDGSTDKTADLLKKEKNIIVAEHPFNKGYGASLKTGIAKAQGDLIAIADADGTYPLKDLPKLVKILKEKDCDMVVGARVKSGAAHPWWRKPGKIIIQALAEFLVGRKIPDLNSGMRVFKKKFGREILETFSRALVFYGHNHPGGADK